MASIDKRPDGRWRARWRDYPNGPQRSKHFGRKIDAEQHLVKVQHELLTGSYVDPAKARTTVREYYAVWSARQPWRASSRASVESIFDRHVIPAFGGYPLGAVRRGDVEAWAAKLPLAGSTTTTAVQYLSAMFADAVADGLLAANPARGAKRPAVDVAPIVPLTGEELERLRMAAPEWFRVAITLGAYAGLRQSEATGLTVDRVNFLGRSCTVDRQLVSPPSGELHFGPPKTARSYRTIPLASIALEELARHVEMFGTGTDGLVLHDGGRPMRRQRFGEVWRALREQAGLDHARFHDTRHTYASTLVSAGVGIAAAAEYLGHTPAVLLKTYAHLMPADHERARDAVQAAFARSAEDLLRTEHARGHRDTASDQH
jgi:integrase